MQSSPGNMRSVILGTLQDLCDNPKTLTHVLAWRGPGGLCSGGLLLELWRQEEEELEVSRDLHGRIAGGVLQDRGVGLSSTRPTHDHET